MNTLGVSGATVAGWIDSHCHIQEKYLRDQETTGRPSEPRGAGTTPGAPVPTPVDPLLLETLHAATEAGVGALVCVGTDAVSSAQALELAHRVVSGELAPGLPRMGATVGLHPHEASAGTEEVGAILEEARQAGDPALLAVGECGLDYHYDHSPRPAQQAAFAAQVALAHRHRLPLVVHAREAWDDLFYVLGAEGVPERAVLHCFTGGPHEARRCLDAGMYVSFSGIVTFKNAKDVQEAARLCPLDRLLVETDSPFLAPVPHRGRPNQPAFVPLVGAAVAAVKGLAVEEVVAATTRTAQEVFGL